ncbi:MAG: DUF3761 domain-containing protein [Patescibacteria group bacterium]|nr:DUF3761 domain-containing protein [Patescibacteria group bacterium]
MRTWIGAFSVAILVANFALADAPAPSESQLQEHSHYTNKSGHSVHSPAHSKNGGTPQGATAKCADGTFSFSQHHRGTCSHHGGVANWLG